MGLIQPAMVTFSVRHQLFWFKPKVDLCIGTVNCITAMDDIPVKEK